MRVRVYDKGTNSFFVSEVYAIINTGFYEKYLVLQELNTKKYFCLVEYLDKSNDAPIYPVNINLISCNELPEPWVQLLDTDLKDLNDKLNAKEKNNSIYSYRGFACLLEHKDLLVSLLRGNTVAYEEMMGIQEEICTKLDGWRYIESEKDTQELMESFYGFHDSVLRNLNYISGSGKGQNGMTVTDHIRQITMVFDSNWSDSIEAVFEGVLALNLRPSRDNYSPDIFSSTIVLRDKTIFFYDDTIDSELENYEGTWVNALGMRWRYMANVSK